MKKDKIDFVQDDLFGGKAPPRSRLNLGRLLL